jgi:lambda family phage portal protein
MNKLQKILQRAIGIGNAPGKRSIAAAQLTNITNDWLKDFRGVNADLRISLRVLRARANEAVLNDPYAKKFIKMLENNVVGPDGFILRNKAFDYQFDEKEKIYVKKMDKVANGIIQENFVEWCKMKNCTITKDVSFREVCSLLLKKIAIDGEILVREIKGKGVNNFGYTLQIIEAEYLDETFNGTFGNNRVIMGVEIDNARRVVAYHLRKQSLTGEIYGTAFSPERERVLADGILHLFVKESPFQLRGISWFAPSLIRLKMLSGFEEATLIDARVSASKSLLLEYKDTATGDEITAANISGGQTDNANNIINDVSPGETFVVPMGMTAKQFDPKSPSGRENAFTENALRGIASGLGVSFIGLANNYSAVNYSSGRLNLLDERDNWRTMHSWFREHFLENMFANWLAMAMLSGKINLPLNRFEKFNQPWFQGRTWPWVDPQKDIQAKITALENNLETMENVLGEMGIDFDEHIEDLKREKKILADAGLAWPSMGKNPAQDVAPDPIPTNGKAHKNIIAKIN